MLILTNHGFSVHCGLLLTTSVSRMSWNLVILWRTRALGGVAYMVHEKDLKWPPISSWNIERTATLAEFDCILPWSSEVMDKLRVAGMLWCLWSEDPSNRSAVLLTKQLGHTCFSPVTPICPPSWRSMGVNIICMVGCLRLGGILDIGCKRMNSPAFSFALLHGAWGGFWTSQDIEKAWRVWATR